MHFFKKAGEWGKVFYVTFKINPKFHQKMAFHFYFADQTLF